MTDHGAMQLEFANTLARERDISRPIVLIGFRRAGNLGMGYLASTLRARCYRVEIVEFEDQLEEIISAVRRCDPLIVGFSLIFQFYVRRYAVMMQALRAAGVTSHFTIGGHFPTLSYAHTLELLPELDSVARFEGELTLLELADTLSLGKDWHSIHGLAWRDGAEVASTPLRPLLPNLDELPYPDRDVKPAATLGLNIAQMLASRGCIRTCSFCSIHMFYRSAPGKVVRTRKPAEVAKEMRYLHEEQGASIFLFQDDDFPVFGNVWKRWTREFLSELWKNELPGRVIWKINARADAIDAELFTEMRDAGMYVVYMGLESGSDEGMVELNKSITVAQNLRAVETLKNLNIQFDFGFMLVDPSSTFESVLRNISFLRQIVGDGYMAAEFCRMIPYDGTPIKDQLQKEGRLRGDVCNPDYDFLDPRLEPFYNNVNELLNLTGWLHGMQALSPQIKYAWNEVAVIERFFPNVTGLSDYRKGLRALTAASNEVLFKTVEELAYAAMDDRAAGLSKTELQAKCAAFLHLLIEQRDGFILKNQKKILRVVRPKKLQAAE